MIEVAKIQELIKSHKWEGILEYLDQIISKDDQQSEDPNDNKHWLIDYQQEKLQIVILFNEALEQSFIQTQPQPTQSASEISLEQCIIKSFSKGLILPQLKNHQDLLLLNKLITNSSNTKYLFMLFQQNLCEIKEIYHSYFLQSLDKVYLKMISVIFSFLKLFGQVIFEDVVKKFGDFFQQVEKVTSEENVIQQENDQVKRFCEDFFENVIKNMEKLFVQGNMHAVDTLNKKPGQRLHLLSLIKLIHSRNAEIDTEKKIKIILNAVVQELDISFIQIQGIPSFWVTENLQTLTKIYSPQILLSYLGIVLLKQLPSRPQYSKIPTHLFNITQWICQYFYFRQTPISSLSLKQNHTFYVDLFERFSILVGLLNKEKQDQKQIGLMINAILNKKNLFSSPILSETLWRQLILRHDDMNFKTFCIGRYKKILALNIKQLQTSCIQVLNNGTSLIVELVSQLQGNSNPQFIGHHITLVVYFLSCLKKFSKHYCSTGETKQIKCQLLFNYFFSVDKTAKIKLNLKQTLFKLKESLKDRLEVYKMKTLNQSQKNQQREKQASEVSICIYRIEEQIKFD